MILYRAGPGGLLEKVALMRLDGLCFFGRPGLCRQTRALRTWLTRDAAEMLLRCCDVQSLPTPHPPQCLVVCATIPAAAAAAVRFYLVVINTIIISAVGPVRQPGLMQRAPSANNNA